MPKADLRRRIDSLPTSPAVASPGVHASSRLVMAVDVPIVDTGAYFDALEVENALQELGEDVELALSSIGNLQAADTIARTGWTVFTHSTHLTAALTATGTLITVADDIFAVGEQAAVSNTAGQIEFMRVTGAATVVSCPGGGVCYRYPVTRRVLTSPAGLVTGWAVSTLINGLTEIGYISIDNRHANSTAAPNMTAAYWTDSPPTSQERVFRLGNLNGVAGVTTDEFGMAFGDLSNNDTYVMYSATREELLLRNTNIVVADSDGKDRVRIFGKDENERLAGDYDFGPLEGVHNTFDGTNERWGVYRGASPIIEITPEHSYLRDLFTIGDAMGARIDLGEVNNRATFALRNEAGVAKAVLRNTETGGVHAYIGNPPPQANSVSYDDETGVLIMDGTVIMESAVVKGTLIFESDGQFVITDPDDPQRRGVITSRGIAGYSVDGLGAQYLSAVDAWGPLTLENRPGSGVWKTWLAGTMMRGDPDFRNFRTERGALGRVGLFNGDTPVVYLDYNGDGHFTGQVYTGEGSVGGWAIRTAMLASPGDAIRLDTTEGLQFFSPESEDPEVTGEEYGESRMVSFWTSLTDDHSSHRISAINDGGSPEEHTLLLQAQPLTGKRARAMLSALGDYQASARVRAVGGYDTANQQMAYIDLWAYRAEGTAPFTHTRIDLSAEIIYPMPYTAAAIPGGTIQNGGLLHSNGTYEPGAGAGVYIWYGGYWVPVALAGDATGWEAVDSSDSGMTAGNVRFYTCDATSGKITINLPAATAKPRNWEYTFHKSDSGANEVAIEPDGAATINGAASYILTAQYQTVTIRRLGANWAIKSTA